MRPVDMAPVPTQQIFTFNPGQEPEFVLDFERLTSLFDEADERRVELISICGPARQGRSFLFNFILRYLKALEGGVEDFLGWDKPNDPLTGFEWGSGDDRKTLGVWMTSKPILIYDPISHEEIAVYLMDTQGVLDEFSTPPQSKFILELCLRVSTMLLFTSAYQLQEEKLIALANAITQTNIRQVRYCNHVYILIRDWLNEPLGEEGGRLYKEKRLQVQSHHSDASREARQVLQSQLQKMDWFLMPPPGPIASKSHYNGSLAGLSPKFTSASTLETFLVNIRVNINENVSGWTPVRKTGTEYAALFADPKSKPVPPPRPATTPVPTPLPRARSMKFNDVNDLSSPPRRAMPRPSAETQLQNLVLDLVADYDTKMKEVLESTPTKFLPEDEFQKRHAELEKFACEKYENCNIQASLVVLRKFQDSLTTKMEELCSHYSTINENQRSICLGEWESAVIQATEIYREELRKLLQNQPTQMITNEQIELAVRGKFDSLVDSNSDMYAIYLQNLVEQFKNAFEEEGVSAEEEREKEHRQQLEAAKTAAVVKYDFEMKRLIQENGGVVSSKEKLRSFHDVAERKGVEVSIDLIGRGHDDAVTSSRHLVAELLDSKFNDILAANNAKLVELAGKKECLEAAISIYKSYMKHWKQELGSASVIMQLDKYEEAARMAREEAKVVLKTRLLHLTDDTTLDASLISELHETIDQLRNEDIAGMAQILSGQRQQIAALIGRYNESMTLKLQELQVPTGETIGSLHDEIVQTFMAELGDNSTEEFKQNLQQTLEGTPLAEFQRKAANKLQARQYEADFFTKKATEKYEAQMKTMVAWSSTQEFANFHIQNLNTAVKELKVSIEVTDESFVEHYVDQLTTEAKKYYEKHLGLLELELERSKVQIGAQINAATKAYEEKMNHLFQQHYFMAPNTFRFESDRIMMEVVSQYGKGLNDRGRSSIRRALLALYPTYKERNTMNTPSENVAIGIDLGTTYSCAAVYLNGNVQIIPSGIGGNTVPSYVGFIQDDELVGEAAKNQAHENPTETIFDAKRLIGRDFNDPLVQADMKLWPFKVVKKTGGTKPTVVYQGLQKDPEVISAKVLKHLKIMAQNFLQVPNVQKAVITVPAYFTDGQREATKDAGFIAGLDVLQIINEPTAAAMAYYLHNQAPRGTNKKNILVYDLGGGTFDVSILEISNGKLEVQSVNGDTHLGGEDFDQAMVQFCVDSFKEKTGVDITSGKSSLKRSERVAAARQLRRLRNECEKRKKDLSEAEQITITVDEVFGHDLNVKMSRTDFENINCAKFERTIEIVQAALTDAHLIANQIDEIVLVGGSTRIPKIQQLLVDFFGGRPLYRKIDPDEAVARGAAILAAKLNGEAAQNVMKLHFSDVTPLSIGTKQVDGRMAVIVPRNTKIPCKISRGGFMTVADYQTKINVRVFEGEDPMAKNNHFLGDFILTDIPPALAGVEKVEETVEITAEGILHVTAKVDSTGKSNDIVIITDKGRLTYDTKVELRAIMAAE